jgi:hypothetical protein
MNEKISEVLAQKDMLQSYIEDLKFFNEDFGDVSYVVNAKKAELRKCNYKLYAAYSFLAFMILLSYLGMLISSYVVGYMLIGGSYLTAFGAVVYSVGFLLLIFDLVKEYD